MTKSPRGLAVATLGLMLATRFVVAIQAQTLLDEAWYASDPAGMAFAAISGPSGSEWALLVSRRGDEQRSELYKNAELDRAWTRSYGPSGLLRREAEERDGRLHSEIFYDALGRPELEREFIEEGALRETRFEYAGDRLVSRETVSGGSTVAVSYLYAPDGRLARVSENSGASLGLASGKSGFSSAWRLVKDNLELRVYGNDGRLRTIVSYRGSSPVSREDRVWADGVLTSSTIVAGDTKTISEYATSGAALGKVLVTRAESGHSTKSIERRGYDDTGRLARIETSALGRTSLVEYAYDGQGVLESTRTSVDGALVSIVRHASPTQRLEELYDAGAMFARIHYKDGRRVLEEIIKAGVVVRTRKFE